jgi:hypothetical protein
VQNSSQSEIRKSEFIALYFGEEEVFMMKMDLLVASRAQCKQVLFNVISEGASKTNVMDLKITRISTPLASPTVPLEHFAAELLVGSRIQSKPRSLGSQGAHDACRRRLVNSSFCPALSIAYSLSIASSS